MKLERGEEAQTGSKRPNHIMNLSPSTFPFACPALGTRATSICKEHKKGVGMGDSHLVFLLQPLCSLVWAINSVDIDASDHEQEVETPKVTGHGPQGGRWEMI